MQITYDHNGQAITVTLDKNADGTYTAKIGERTHIVSAFQAADGRWMLEFGGKKTQVYTASDGARRFAQIIGGDSFTLRVAESKSRRRGGATSEGKLSAQMPGQVVDVLVSAGDEVKAGQALVVLEAMKMEIRVTAPKDGMVREVYVKKGDVVEREQQLARLE